MDPEGGDSSASVVSYAFAGGVLDVAAREWTANGSVKTLEPKAFALLLYLVRNRHRVVPRAELRQAIWAGTVVCEGVISQCVWTVRRSIGDRTRRRVIAAVNGVGYRFVAQVLERRSPSGARELPGNAPAIEAALARLKDANDRVGRIVHPGDARLLELASACQAFADAILRARLVP